MSQELFCLAHRLSAPTVENQSRPASSAFAECQTASSEINLNVLNADKTLKGSTTSAVLET
jgi:hypothetical protein